MPQWHATAEDVKQAVLYSLTNNPGALSFTLVNLVLTGLLNESFTDAVTAHAGGGPTNAVALTTELIRVSTVATSGDSVALPPSSPGLTIIVVNTGANPMQVFGAGTDTINGVATATGVSQMQASVVHYVCTTAGAWLASGLGGGYAGSLPTVSAVTGITAHAGGGQASAVALPAVLNRITVCATGGDSTVLPPSAAGLEITVTNAGAASCNVFPLGTDQINALGASNAFALAATKTVTLFCCVAGQWHTLLSA